MSLALGLKTVERSSPAKLLDVPVSILAGCWAVMQVNTRLQLEQIVSILENNEVLYCVIGSQGVNAYVDLLVSRDLALVIAAEHLEQVEALLEASGVELRRFAHSPMSRCPAQACVCIFRLTHNMRLFRKRLYDAKSWV